MMPLSIRENRGFTLTELVLSLGIASVAVLAGLAIYQIGNNGARSVLTGTDFNDIRSSIFMSLADPNTCKVALQAIPGNSLAAIKTAPNAQVPVQIYMPPSPVGSAPTQLIVADSRSPAATRDPVDGMTYAVTLSGTPWGASDPDHFKAMISIVGNRAQPTNQNFYGSPALQAQIPVDLELDPGTGDTTIASCQVRPVAARLYGGAHSAQQCIMSNGMPKMDPKFGLVCEYQQLNIGTGAGALVNDPGNTNTAFCGPGFAMNNNNQCVAQNLAAPPCPAGWTQTATTTSVSCTINQPSQNCAALNYYTTQTSLPGAPSTTCSITSCCPAGSPAACATSYEVMQVGGQPECVLYQCPTGTTQVQPAPNLTCSAFQAGPANSSQLVALPTATSCPVGWTALGTASIWTQSITPGSGAAPFGSLACY